MSVYRTPGIVPPEPSQSDLIVNRNPNGGCGMCREVWNGVIIRRGYHRLVSGIYGSPTARYAYVCNVCGDQWQ